MTGRPEPRRVARAPLRRDDSFSSGKIYCNRDGIMFSLTDNIIFAQKKKKLTPNSESAFTHLCQQHLIIYQVLAAGFAEHFQQAFNSHPGTLIPADIQDNPAFMHHYGPVPYIQGMLQVMCDHESGQV